MIQGTHGHVTDVVQYEQLEVLELGVLLGEIARRRSLMLLLESVNAVCTALLKDLLNQIQLLAADVFRFESEKLFDQQVFERFQRQRVSTVAVLQLVQQPVVELLAVGSRCAGDHRQTVPEFVRLRLREMKFFRRCRYGEDEGQELKANGDLLMHGERRLIGLQAFAQLFEIVEEHVQHVVFLFEEHVDVRIRSLLLLLKNQEELRQ